MKNNYISPNKKCPLSLKLLPLMATTLFTAFEAQAQSVPNLFATNKKTTNTSTEVNSDKIIFDIRVAGKYAGTALVSFTDSWVKVENPYDILDQLPTVRDAEAFLPLFTGKIYSNDPREVVGVGSVSVNPLDFTMNIVVAKEQAINNTRERGATSRSTANHVSLSSRMRLTGSTDLDPSATDSLGLTHTSIISRGQWRMQNAGSYVKNEGYDFANMQVEHDIGTNIYSLGMLRTDGTNFASSEDFYGFSVKSNIRGLGDLKEFQATPLEIFVPSTAMVRIFRNDTQVIYTKEHEFGLESIETRRFPSGSYEIRIEITENTGTITEETRFFQKSSSLRPREHPEFSLSLGIQRDALDIADKPVYQFSYAARVSDNVELSTTLFGIDSKFVIEPRIKGFFGNAYDYNAALSYTSENDASFIGNISYNPIDSNNRLTWFLRTTQTLTGHQQDLNDFDEFDFMRNLSRSRSLFTGSVNYRFDKVTWAFSGQKSKNFGSDTSYSYGPALNWRLYYRNGHQLSAKANITRTRTATDRSIFLTYRYNPVFTNWDYSSSIGSLKTGGKTSNKLRQAVTYSNRKSGSYGSSFNASNNLSLTGDDNVHTSTIGATHDTKNVAFSVNYQNLDGNEINSSEFIDYALDTTFLATQDDIVDVENSSYTFAPSRGGRNHNIIITLAGNAIGEEVAINLDGVVRTYGKVGEKIAFEIPSYGGSKLSITSSNESSSLLEYDSSPIDITLYPGNIAQKTWVINKVFLLTGRAVDNKGEPIKWQRIEGLKHYTTTDGSGYFQIEILGSETPYINTNKKQCVFAMPNIGEDEPFVQIGDILCG